MIKQFLKPNKKKIVIFVVTILIAYLSTLLLPGVGDRPQIGSSFSTVLFVILTIPLFIPDLFTGILGPPSFLIPIFLFFVLIYLYFVSCLIYRFLNSLLKKGKTGKHAITVLGLIMLCVLFFSIYVDKINRENWMPSGANARRQSDIRQISLAMEIAYDDEGQYPEITTTNGRINIKVIGDHYLDPVPTDIGYGTITGCNDVKSAPYRGFDNASDRSRYCIYACLEGEGFFVTSHKGTKMLNEPPTNLDCW